MNFLVNQENKQENENDINKKRAKKGNKKGGKWIWLKTIYNFINILYHSSYF